MPLTQAIEEHPLLKKAESAKKLICTNRIKSQKTIAYLDKFGLKKHEDLAKVQSLCYTQETKDSFYKHTKSYEVSYNIEKVWDTYINIPPAICWTGRRISFSFAYDPSSQNISYLDDIYDGLKVGQLIFIEIKILFGLIKLAVTHQVNQVNEEDKTIKLCYVNGGKSEGSQMIHFEKINENETRVIHDTFYKSDSKFRDEKVYPMLHERILNQFHSNVHGYLDC